MGRATRSVPRDRMSQKRLDALIINPTPIAVEREHIDPHPVLTFQEEYDTLQPEETFRQFNCKIRDMLSRYEGDKERLGILESQMQDLLHFIEMSKNKNVNAGFKLYKQLCAIRRERRACKNEIELLQPVYNMFHDTGMLNKLTQVQGECKTAKQIIDSKGYTVRTDILETLEE